MRILTPQPAVLAIGLALATASAQNSRPPDTHQDLGAVSVRLEAHEGNTKFKFGDPVVLDLVFTTQAQGYAVDTDTRPYLPPSDLPEIIPNVGWVRSHTVLTDHGLNGNAMVHLGSEPVRVPVLLNRSITFLQPGHYEVSLSIKRILIPRDSYTSLDCETNSVPIDLSLRGDSEEAALVASLGLKLEETKGEDIRLPQEQEDGFRRQSANLYLRADMTEAEQRELLQKINKLVNKRMAAITKRKAERRNAAIRLAYLPGDDALRAKVHFLAISDEEVGQGDPIAPIMLDGLPSSKNKQLQLDLIVAAWQDPNHLPTDVLQDAVRESRQLVNGQTVTDYSLVWAGTSEQHAAAMKEYRDEINQLIATLPLRSETNRAKTIEYMKKLAAPNPLNSSEQ